MESKNSISLLLIEDPDYHPVRWHNRCQGRIVREGRSATFAAFPWDSTRRGNGHSEHSSLPSAAGEERSEVGGVRGRSTRRRGLTIPASMEEAQQLGTGEGLSQTQPLAQGHVHPAKSVSSLRHPVSGFLGCNNSHRFFFNMSHLTVLEKWFPSHCC